MGTPLTGSPMPTRRIVSAIAVSATFAVVSDSTNPSEKRGAMTSADAAWPASVVPALGTSARSALPPTSVSRRRALTVLPIFVDILSRLIGACGNIDIRLMLKSTANRGVLNSTGLLSTILRFSQTRSIRCLPQSGGYYPLAQPICH